MLWMLPLTACIWEIPPKGHVQGCHMGINPFQVKLWPHYVHLYPPIVDHREAPFVSAGSCSSNEDDAGCNTMRSEVWWIGLAWSDVNKLGYLCNFFFWHSTACLLALQWIYHCIFPPPPFPVAKHAPWILKWKIDSIFILSLFHGDSEGIGDTGFSAICCL